MAGDRRLVTLRRLLGQTRRYRPSVEALFLLSLLASPLELLTPLPLKIVVDSAIGSHPLPRLVDRVPEAVSRSPAALASFAVVLLVAVVLVSRLLALWRTLLRARLTGRLILDFRGRLFRQVRRVSGASFSLSSIQHDVPAIPRVLTESFIPLIVSAVTLLGMIYVTDRIDRQLALIALGISPGLFVTSSAFRGRLRLGRTCIAPRGAGCGLGGRPFTGWLIRTRPGQLRRTATAPPATTRPRCAVLRRRGNCRRVFRSDCLG